MSFEDQISNKMFQTDSEKTFIDKVLARQDSEAIRMLMKKPKLTRTDLLEILYLLSSVEAKLLNYGEWDRYVILKFFVWIREFVKVAEQLFDYEDDLMKKDKEGKKPLTPRARQLIDNNQRLMEHNIKFLVDLYLNIGRTSLSVGATGLMEILKNKYEIVYPGAGGVNTPMGDQKQQVNMRT